LNDHGGGAAQATPESFLQCRIKIKVEIARFNPALDEECKETLESLNEGVVCYDEPKINVLKRKSPPDDG